MVNHFDTFLDSHNNAGSVGSVITKTWSYAGLGAGGGGLFAHDSSLGQLSQVALTGQDATPGSTSRIGIPGYTAGQSYSVTMVVSVFHGGAGTSTFNARMEDADVSVPDGGSTVSFLGFALLALAGLTAWIKRLHRA
jgi:hypothetical protein